MIDAAPQTGAMKSDQTLHGGLPAHQGRGSILSGSGALPFLLGNVLLGTIGIFVFAANAHPLTAAWSRCAFGWVGLSVWLLCRREMCHVWLTRDTAPWVLIAASLMVASWGLFFDAIGRTSAGMAVVLFHVQPLFVLGLGGLWLGEPVGRARLGFVMVAMVGLLLATGLLEQAESVRGTGYWIGVGACLLGALCTAGATLIARRLGNLRAGVLAWWQCAIGTTVLLAWPLQHGWPPFGASWAWLAGIGLVHTALAYTLIYAGMARLRTARFAVFQFVYPATAVLMDWLVLGRGLSTLQIAGIGVMAAAILMAERKHGQVEY